MIYVHIPFCEHKCHYCGFNSFAGSSPSEHKAYFSALKRQLAFDLATNPHHKTLYIGGGTPSFVAPDLYGCVFEILGGINFQEATIEANPGSITQDWLKAMKDFGINRVSIGVQSFDDAKLKFLTRAHSAKDALRAYEMCAKEGFETSLDLIYDTALDTKELLDAELARLKALRPVHLSAYSLTLEEQTKFFSTPHKKQNNEDLSAYFFRALDELFGAYEISNFGKIALHNSGYWAYEDYIGAGCGAVGKLGSARLYPHSELAAYIKDPLFKRLEPISAQDENTERIFLGLRSFVGVDPRALSPAGVVHAQDLVQAGLLELRQDLGLGSSAKDLVQRSKALDPVQDLAPRSAAQDLFNPGGRLYNPNFLIADELALYLMD